MTYTNTLAQSFSYSFESIRTPEDIFKYLLDVRKWWVGLYDEKITGASGKVADEFSFTAGGGFHHTQQRLIELVPAQKIAWLVAVSKLTFLSDPGEWGGTKICFDISRKVNTSTVKFTHEGLNTGFESYENCSVAWTGYLKKLETNLK